MKRIIVTLMAFVITATTAFAAGSMFDGMTKEQLAGYEIQIVEKSSGKVVGKMSRAEYKVVRIDTTPGPAGLSGHESVAQLRQRVNDQAVANQGLAQRAHDAEEVSKPYKSGYNTIILHAGAGKKGLTNSLNGGEYEVAEKDAFVAGLTGCRSVENKGLCGTALSNKTFLLGLKLDFK